MPGRKTREQSRYRLVSARLAALIRDARVDQDVTQQKLANAADVAISTIRKVESNEVVEPGFFTVLAICRELDVDITNFIQEELPKKTTWATTPPEPAN